MKVARVAFLGLGAMGYPMAGHLARAYRLSVYNRSPAKTARWLREFDGEGAQSAGACAGKADIVVTCLADDRALRAVVLGENAGGGAGEGGVLAAMKAGALLLDHSTVSARLAREIHRIGAARSIGVVDAPLSGGEPGAKAGTLSVMAGGDKRHLERLRPLLSFYAQRVVHMGKAGCGQLTKMANQICAASLLQGLAEGLHFARAAALDGGRVLEALGGGAASSWQMAHRGESMLRGEFDFGFAVDWMRKDLRLCLEEARLMGTPLPATEMVERFYAEIQEMGGGRWDSSSLITRLGRRR